MDSVHIAKRRRLARERRVGSEADSYEGEPDILSPIDHTFEEHRVGAPPLPQLPLQNGYLEEGDAYEKYEDETFQRQIEKILERYGIQVDERALVLRFTELTPPEDGLVTFCIRTEKGAPFVEASQRKCVAELYNLFNKTHNLAVTIEIIGHKFWAPRSIACIEAQHPFLSSWSTGLYETFANILEEDGKLHGHICSVDPLRLGFNCQDPSQNPIVVSITVDRTVDPPAWKKARGKMMEALGPWLEEGIEVEFERGEVVFGAADEPDKRVAPKFTDMTPEQAACTDIRPGSSISSGTRQAPGPHPLYSGTAGPVMEIVKSSTEEVLGTVVLTNHRVVRATMDGFQLPTYVSSNDKEKEVWSDPTAGSLCATIDRDGYWQPQQTGGLKPQVSTQVFRSPSLRKIQQTIETRKSQLAKDIAENGEPELDEDVRETLESKIASDQSFLKVLEDPNTVQEMGSIFYSGGLSRKHAGLGRLDVAAIFIEGEASKKASNDIRHRVADWPDKDDRPLAAGIKRINLNFGKDSDAHKGSVFKIGSMTGCSNGTVCPKPCHGVWFPFHVHRNDRSTEIAVVGEAGLKHPAFSWKGDSGAAVFDKYGKWLGLVYGGQTKMNTIQPMTYVVPAWAILEDVKRFSNNKIELRLKGWQGGAAGR